LLEQKKLRQAGALVMHVDDVGNRSQLVDDPRNTMPSWGNGEAIEIMPSNFEAVVVQNSAPVLAYFWAPW
jgi:thioredoxin-like negative regulator of GroEL